jgi:hypothetical protein
MTDGRGIVVWITGPEPARLDALADEVGERLSARGLPVEVLNGRSPALTAFADPAGAAGLSATLLARHGVTTVIALPATRAARDSTRNGARLIEVDVPGTAARAGHEPPDRAEVEVTGDDGTAGAACVMRALELLGLLAPADDPGYSPDEERAVIRRLKAFGYL